MYKIMIIDDDMTSLAIGRALLEDKYELTLAKSGIQALGALKGGITPDLILLDMMMPGLDGFSLLKKLKKDPKLAGVPVIFLTAEGNLEKQAEGLRSGAADFLQKPVNPDLLEIKIEREIARFQLEQENALLRRSLHSLREQIETLCAAYP